MIEYFSENSKLVKDQVFLIKNGILAKNDVLPIYNLREVVYHELDKDDSMAYEANINTMEGGN